MDSDFTTTDPGPVVGSPTAPSLSLSVAEPAGKKQRTYIRYYFSRILYSSPCTSCRLVENFSMQYYFLSYSLSAFFVRWRCVASLLAESEMQARVSGGWGEVMNCITLVRAQRYSV